MDLFDFFLIPLYFLLIYSVAKVMRRKYTNNITRQYFLKGLTVKLIGALALGFVFQFYYGNGSRMRGDTGKYYHQGNVITDAILENPIVGLKLLSSDASYDPDTYKYVTQIGWYNSKTEFFIVKTSGIFGLFAFKSYGAIALLFAATSFIGMWAMFLTFYKIYPALHKQFAYAVFFLPSVFFWGSGLMKDSLTLGALGLLFHGFYSIAIEKKRIISSLIYTLLAAYVISVVKIYILLAFLPPALFWIFIENNQRIKSAIIRNLARPVFLVVGGIAAYFGASTLTEGDAKYDVENIGERTKINAVYLSEYVESGSAYNIGIFDGSLNSFIAVAPQAVVVALYRPFIWEVRNPIMLLSAIEASIFIFLTLSLFFKTGIFKSFRLIGSVPILFFCMAFSIIFAFAVGSNSGNFGTLVRYKIPLLPFYLSGLFIMRYYYTLRKPAKLRKKVLSPGRLAVK